MYKIEFNDFFTSAFSVDCIIFGYEAGEIKALLIKRAMEPYDNYWAIPGDLVYPDEDLPVAAERILKELTGLDHIQMHQSQSIPVVITKNNVNLEFNLMVSVSYGIVEVLLNVLSIP